MGITFDRDKGIVVLDLISADFRGVISSVSRG